MSENNPLPDDLARIERRLLVRPMDESPVLRNRVLAAVTQELTRPAANRAAGHWSQFAAAAAVAIVALNLARMSAMATHFVGAPTPRPAQTLALAAEIRAVAPELSAAEAQRMAIVMAAGERLTPVPIVHGAGVLNSSNFTLQER